MPSTIYPLILSGGSGSRLWPLSRNNLPKQFLSLSGELPMLAETALRVHGEGFAAPTVICNEAHRFLVAESLRQGGVTARRIILEPCARNTAPAIAAASLHIAAEDSCALVLVLPSDHLVRDVPAFHAAIGKAAAAARQGRIVTFGIEASGPETGYGYIQRGEALGGLEGVHAIARFVEKPDRGTAEAYLAEGGYDWNAGMFCFCARDVLDAFARHAPETLEAARAALAASGEDYDFLRLDGEAFAASPSQPFDIAIMEKTDRGAVVPVEMGWSDIGSWQALWDVAERCEDGNATSGDVLLRDCTGNLIRSEHGMLTAAIGAKDLVIVATEDAVLVADRSRAEEVKQLVDAMKSDPARAERLNGLSVQRPWGSYREVERGNGYLVKRIEVHPGASLSLQYHHHRAEHWVVVSGEATVTRGEKQMLLKENESTFIPIGMPHRLENRSETPLVLVEVQSGETLSEEDIVRIEDKYGRIRQQ